MRPEDYEILYNLPSGEYDGGGIGGMRTVTIRAGASLEIMCHPIFKRWPEGTRREAKARRTVEKMAAVNRRNLERKIMRYIEHNFTNRALVLTGTYDYPMEDIGLMNIDDALAFYEERGLPESMDAARRHVRNFLARVKRKMKAPKALKWLYVVEEGAKEMPFGLPPRYHFHMVIEAGELTRDDLQAMWPFGFTDCNHLRLKDGGAAQLAHYFVKQKRGGRSWSHSRNLKLPVPRVSDRRLSRRRAARMAEDVRVNGKEILEKLYPGYRLVMEPQVHFSDFLAGVFIYARMRRRD